MDLGPILFPPNILTTQMSTRKQYMCFVQSVRYACDQPTTPSHSKGAKESYLCYVCVQPTNAEFPTCMWSNYHEEMSMCLGDVIKLLDGSDPN